MLRSVLDSSSTPDRLKLSMADDANSALQTLTAEIVSAYVSNNKIGSGELPKLIGDTHHALSAVSAPTPAEPETYKPDKAAIKKSLHPDYLTSFLDGRRYKSLKRHLNTQGMSPDEYRTRFGLAKDYPMVAPSYSAQRSALAKTLGLGRKGAAAPPKSAPAAAPDAKRSKASRAPKPKVIKLEDESFT